MAKLWRQISTKQKQQLPMSFRKMCKLHQSQNENASKDLTMTHNSFAFFRFANSATVISNYDRHQFVNIFLNLKIRNATISFCSDFDFAGWSSILVAWRHKHINYHFYFWAADATVRCSWSLSDWESESAMFICTNWPQANSFYCLKEPQNTCRFFIVCLSWNIRRIWIKWSADSTDDTSEFVAAEVKMKRNCVRLVQLQQHSFRFHSLWNVLINTV